jgi:hypothetical protein
MDDKYKVDVPEGKSGDWSISKFTVSAEDEKWGRLRAAISSSRGRFVPAGTYTGLYHKNSVVMSDTPDEIRDHWEPIHYSSGNVLIAGLGLGVVLQAILNKPTVENVTVIEKSADVIKLVGRHYSERFGGRVKIINDDILTWKPERGTHYKVAWFDIWNDLCTDNLPQMKLLHRKFARKSDWKGSWGREWLRGR